MNTKRAMKEEWQGKGRQEIMRYTVGIRCEEN